MGQKRQVYKAVITSTLTKAPVSAKEKQPKNDTTTVLHCGYDVLLVMHRNYFCTKLYQKRLPDIRRTLDIVVTCSIQQGLASTGASALLVLL